MTRPIHREFEEDLREKFFREEAILDAREYEYEQEQRHLEHSNPSERALWALGAKLAIAPGDPSPPGSNRRELAPASLRAPTPAFDSAAPIALSPNGFDGSEGVPPLSEPEPQPNEEAA